MSGRVFIVTKCSLASQFHPYTILFAVAESIQSGTRFTSSKQPRISAKNHLLIAFKRRVLDIVRRYLLADRYPKVTAWLFCNWYIEFNREHLIPLRKDSKPRASLRGFFYAPPKEQVVDRVIAAFAWSYYRVVELPMVRPPIQTPLEPRTALFLSDLIGPSLTLSDSVDPCPRWGSTPWAPPLELWGSSPCPFPPAWASPPSYPTPHSRYRVRTGPKPGGGRILMFMVTPPPRLSSCTARRPQVIEVRWIAAVFEMSARA